MRKTFMFLWTSIFVLSVSSQQADLDQLFRWTVSLSQPQITQGASSFIDLTLQVAPDHFAYQKMTSVTVSGPEGFQASEPITPTPVVKRDPTDGEEKPVYENTVRFRIPFSAAVNTPEGEMPLTVTVRYQGCSQTLCYFPQTREFPLTLQVTAGTGAPPLDVTVSSTPVAGGTSSASSDFFSRGYLLTYLIVFGFGILTSFTPCVYPLIPITVSIFGARDTQSKIQAFTLAFTYVMGIVVMYSALGYLAASTQMVFGQFMTNPWIIGAISLFFVVLGLSMMGLFEFQLPSSLQTRLSRVGGHGYGSAFLMGLVAGIVAAPCTGPILAGILTYVATEGNPFWGLTLLMTYSFGLGMLFLVIGTFSGLITRLPRSGGWMEGVKSVFAIVLFVCALYFLKNAVPFLRLPFTLTAGVYALAALLLASGIGLGALHLPFHHGGAMTRVRKTLGVLLCVAAVYLTVGTQASVRASELNWIHNLDEGLALAKQEGKPVLIDFWAEWCAICKEIDHYTLRNPAVEEALKRFVTIKIDLTNPNTETNQAIMQKYSIPGLPLIVFYDTRGTLLENKKITGFINTKDFLNHIADIR